MLDFGKRDRAAFLAGRLRVLTEDERALLARAELERRIKAAKVALGEKYILHPANYVQRKN